jgi:DNA-directed RNA polymerase subunit RPC12/RpoP
MPLLNRLKDAVGVGRGDVEYRYHCRNCDAEFETEEMSLSKVVCPVCDASGSRNISRM